MRYRHAIFIVIRTVETFNFGGRARNLNVDCGVFLCFRSV